MKKLSLTAVLLVILCAPALAGDIGSVGVFDPPPPPPIPPVAGGFAIPAAITAILSLVLKP